jgi:hypothetical protein
MPEPKDASGPRCVAEKWSGADNAQNASTDATTAVVRATPWHAEAFGVDGWRRALLTDRPFSAALWRRE